jgi:polysaccharide export outer membrane protein
MSRSIQGRMVFGVMVVLVVCGSGLGCMTTTCCCPPSVPHELSRVTRPPYVIEPPDILVIDAVRLTPKPPYHIEPLDVLGIALVKPEVEVERIRGLYSVEPAGTVNLGFSYGSVSVVGLTIEEAKKAIEKHLKTILKTPKDLEPEIQIQLAEFKAMQQVRGEHLVHPDGSINLGTYGSLLVDGLTIAEAKEAIEAHLSKFLNKPEVSVDVGGFNHDVIYLIGDSLNGEAVIAIPSTGKETVLDAVSKIGGLSAVSCRQRVTVVRPAPSEMCCNQVLPVDWIGITQRGETATNYQLFPNDRIYVHADPLLKLDATLAKIIAPVERVFGIILLGNSVNVALHQGTSGNGTGTGTGTGTGIP